MNEAKILNEEEMAILLYTSAPVILRMVERGVLRGEQVNGHWKFQRKSLNSDRALDEDTRKNLEKTASQIAENMYSLPTTCKLLDNPEFLEGCLVLIDQTERLRSMIEKAEEVVRELQERAHFLIRELTALVVELRPSLREAVSVELSPEEVVEKMERSRSLGAVSQGQKEPTNPWEGKRKARPYKDLVEVLEKARMSGNDFCCPPRPGEDHLALSDGGEVPDVA